MDDGTKAYLNTLQEVCKYCFIMKITKKMKTVNLSSGSVSPKNDDNRKKEILLRGLIAYPLVLSSSILKTLFLALTIASQG